MCVLSCFSRVQLFATPWTVAHLAPLSMARILEWLPFPSPGTLPDPEIEPASLTSPALAGGFFTTNAHHLGSLLQVHCFQSQFSSEILPMASMVFLSSWLGWMSWMEEDTGKQNYWMGRG